MYAIIRTGGKQYRVQPGDVVRVEKINKDLGDEFDLTDVLVVGGEQAVVGEPTVDGAKVTVVVTNQSKLPKVIVFKKKRRQGYRRLRGHRQFFTELFIKQIAGPNGTAKADASPKVYDPEAAKAVKKAKAEESAAEKKTAKKAGVKKAAKKTVTKKKAATKKKATKKKKVTKKTKTKKKAAAKKTAKKKTTTTKKKTAKKKTAKKKS